MEKGKRVIDCIDLDFARRISFVILQPLYFSAQSICLSRPRSAKTPLPTPCFPVFQGRVLGSYIEAAYIHNKFEEEIVGFLE